MTNKDTNSQDSIQVGNESIQTMQSVEKEEVMENCQQCGSYICKCEVKEFIPQSTTLGTTMEETLKEEFQNVWFANGLDPEHFERVKNEISNWWLEKLSQSKTDLLNALIGREESKKEKCITEYGQEITEAIIYNDAKTDTINHLKSLRDTQD